MRKTVSIEDAWIQFRNFSGKEGRFNPAGRRNFCVMLPPDLAGELRDEGWNIRTLPPREEGDTPQDYVQVSVNFNNIPPKIVMISNSGKTVLDEDSVGILDWAEITKVDLSLNASHWELNGRGGVKAYLKTMYVTIYEDEFEKKYRDLPNAPEGAR